MNIIESDNYDTFHFRSKQISIILLLLFGIFWSIESLQIEMNQLRSQQTNKHLDRKNISLLAEPFSIMSQNDRNSSNSIDDDDNDNDNDHNNNNNDDYDSDDIINFFIQTNNENQNDEKDYIITIHDDSDNGGNKSFEADGIFHHHQKQQREQYRNRFEKKNEIKMKTFSKKRESIESNRSILSNGSDTIFFDENRWNRHNNNEDDDDNDDQLNRSIIADRSSSSSAVLFFKKENPSILQKSFSLSYSFRYFWIILTVLVTIFICLIIGFLYIQKVGKNRLEDENDDDDDDNDDDFINEDLTKTYPRTDLNQFKHIIERERLVVRCLGFKFGTALPYPNEMDSMFESETSTPMLTTINNYLNHHSNQLKQSTQKQQIPSVKRNSERRQSSTSYPGPNTLAVVNGDEHRFDVKQ